MRNAERRRNDKRGHAWPRVMGAMIAGARQSAGGGTANSQLRLAIDKAKR